MKLMPLYKDPEHRHVFDSSVAPVRQWGPMNLVACKCGENKLFSAIRVCVWNSRFRSGCDYERILRVDGGKVTLTGLKPGFHVPLTIVDESVPQDSCPPDRRDLTVWHERILSYNGCKIKNKSCKKNRRTML
jgi:hypothetical protein